MGPHSLIVIRGQERSIVPDAERVAHHAAGIDRDLTLVQKMSATILLISLGAGGIFLVNVPAAVLGHFNWFTDRDRLVTVTALVGAIPMVAPQRVSSNRSGGAGARQMRRFGTLIRTVTSLHLRHRAGLSPWSWSLVYSAAFGQGSARRGTTLPGSSPGTWRDARPTSFAATAPCRARRHLGWGYASGRGDRVRRGVHELYVTPRPVPWVGFLCFACPPNGGVAGAAVDRVPDQR